METKSLMKRLGALWFVWVPVVAIVIFLSLPSGRDLAQRFLDSLRMQKVQAVNVDLSSFVGPGANRSLQQMVSQMISDKVTVTLNESEQAAADVATAGQIAGFKIQLLSKRKDPPKLSVTGAHALQMTVDRGRLQAIFNEAGRSDLVLPATLDNAQVFVKISRGVHAQYGNCPVRGNAAEGVTGPPPPTTEFSNCVYLTEGPSPVVDFPASLHIEQLAEIGLELAGMSPTQAQEFLKTVNWKTTLGMSVPRFMRSYEGVEINGVRGTLLNTVGRRGPTYTLVWAKDGIVYSLVGYGSSGEALTLAESVK
ncbi:MAG: hypothetical protein WAM91_13780 [Candidatus Acidiferrales bacterium]